MKQTPEELADLLVMQSHQNYAEALFYAAALNAKIKATPAPFRHEVKNAANLFCSKYKAKMEADMAKMMGQTGDVKEAYDSFADLIVTIARGVATLPHPFLPAVVNFLEEFHKGIQEANEKQQDNEISENK